MKHKSRKSLSVLPLVLVVPVILLVLFSWYRRSLSPVNPATSDTAIFVIAKGEPTNKIISNLKQQNLIRSPAAAKIYLYLSKQTGSLQAGSFRLSPAMPLSEVINQLQHGTLDVWVTVPEGWRSEQIVDELTGNELLADIPKTELYRQFRLREGQLFPDTYLFAKDSSADLIIQKMTDNFQQKTSELGIKPQDIILASLVEREAKHPEDRPKIAAVLKNRLDIGMALQVDATLQYAKANENDWWPQITAADKAIQSLYNTYKYPGLPPGPIASPGLSSIKAALSPNEVDYLYYLSEPDGTTHYATTLEEHNANIRKYLR